MDHHTRRADDILATPDEIAKLKAGAAASRDAIHRTASNCKPTTTPTNKQLADRPALEPVPAYTPFPFKCLPERVHRFAATVADSTGADMAYVALALLSVLGAAIGTTRAVMPKRGWKIFASVWAIMVGRSSATKSPPLALINEAVQIVEDKLEEENVQRMNEYMQVLAQFEAGKKAKGATAEEPPKPHDQRFRLSDLTIEALAFILSGNPRGVWMSCDEAAGWLTSFTRYKGAKGDSDRPRWLSLFDSGGLTIDRKTGDPRTIRVRNAMVSVVGGIQPQVLAGLMTEENVSSGLFARILVAYPPDKLTQWNDTEVPDELIEELAELLFDLRKLEHEEYRGQPSPRLNSLSADAKQTFITYYNTNRERAFVADDCESSTLVKLEAYALRFAHIRHLCRYAKCGDKRPIDVADVAAGISLANWFAGELARIRVALAEPEVNLVAKRLFTWISRRGGVTVSDLQRFQKRRFKTAAMAVEFLEAGVKQGCGHWKDTKATNGKIVRTFVPVVEATYDIDSEGAYYAVSPDAENTPKNGGKTGDSETASSNVVRSTGVAEKNGSLEIDTPETRGFKWMSELNREPSPEVVEHIDPVPVTEPAPKPRRFKSNPNPKDGAR